MVKNIAILPLRVELAVGVWAQLRNLSKVDAELLFRELDVLATKLSQEPWGGPESPSPAGLQTLVVAGVPVLLEVSQPRRVMVVLKVG